MIVTASIFRSRIRGSSCRQPPQEHTINVVVTQLVLFTILLFYFRIYEESCFTLYGETRVRTRNEWLSCNLVCQLHSLWCIRRVMLRHTMPSNWDSLLHDNESSKRWFTAWLNNEISPNSSMLQLLQYRRLDLNGVKPGAINLMLQHCRDNNILGSHCTNMGELQRWLIVGGEVIHRHVLYICVTNDGSVWRSSTHIYRQMMQLWQTLQKV